MKLAWKFHKCQVWINLYIFNPTRINAINNVSLIYFSFLENIHKTLSENIEIQIFQVRHVINLLYVFFYFQAPLWIHIAKDTKFLFISFLSERAKELNAQGCTIRMNSTTLEVSLNGMKNMYKIALCLFLRYAEI